MDNTEEKTMYEWDKRMVTDLYAWRSIILISAIPLFIMSASFIWGLVLFFYPIAIFFKKKNSYNQITCTNKRIFLKNRKGDSAIIKLDDIYSFKKQSYKGMVKIDNRTNKNTFVRFKNQSYADDFMSKVTSIINENGGFVKKPINAKAEARKVGAMMAVLYFMTRR